MIHDDEKLNALSRELQSLSNLMLALSAKFEPVEKWEQRLAHVEDRLRFIGERIEERVMIYLVPQHKSHFGNSEIVYPNSSLGS